MNTYLIMGYDSCPYEVQCKNVIDSVVEFAKYCGDYNDVFATAMSGVQSPEMAIKMFNHFSSSKITEIYLIADKFTER